MSEPRPSRSIIVVPEAQEAEDVRPVPTDVIGPGEESDPVPRASEAVDVSPDGSKAKDLRPVPLRAEEE